MASCRCQCMSFNSHGRPIQFCGSCSGYTISLKSHGLLSGAEYTSLAIYFVEIQYIVRSLSLNIVHLMIWKIYYCMMSVKVIFKNISTDCWNRTNQKLRLGPITSVRYRLIDLLFILFDIKNIANHLQFWLALYSEQFNITINEILPL